MTQEEIAAQKNKMFVLCGVAVASLIASYAIGYMGLLNSVSNLTALLLTAIFLACIFLAGRIALRLNRESASR